ncbi:MAG: 2-oxoacid:acceptor oxidoreductase family protein [Dehalococcoidia bacterium]|nr:2-oxoacid:acceptor oxidoreductase family protein [Dehalococcoidia bacterium]
MADSIRQLCLAPEGEMAVLQGNIAFAVGCVRGGVHAADGYPGTPSTEVIDRGLSEVQDLITVGWSVNEAIASAVGHGHAMAGRDCVVTMKIPGLYQAADAFTTGALYGMPRGSLVYYVASDFIPSATQHTIDPRYLFKSCFLPVLEPRNHQEMHEAAALAVEIGRHYNTQVVVMPSGVLCHSEGLVRLMPMHTREPVDIADNFRQFNALPAIARANYDRAVGTRMPALTQMVENSPLNRWEKGSGRLGVITYGVCDMFVREVKHSLDPALDVLSLAFTNPLPLQLITRFCESIDGPVFVIEDGYRFVQEALLQAGLKVYGKTPDNPTTEWSPAEVAERLGLATSHPRGNATPVPRPPAICPGCPYRLFALEVAAMKKKGLIDVVFGDIGCYALLYFLNAVDTALCMGAGEAMRQGFVLSRPEEAARCLAVVGDSTECHTGMAATRNAVLRNIAGVKVILDNSWTAMTGGQPSPTSPHNLAGQEIKFDLPKTIEAHGAKTRVVAAYDRKAVRSALNAALSDARNGFFSTIVIREGQCIRQSAVSTQRVQADPDICRQCGLCLVCPGIEKGPDGMPVSNQLCSGCGGHTPACTQMCPFDALKITSIEELDSGTTAEYPEPPEVAHLPVFSSEALPGRLSLAIRGVGGQGSLFFGRVLTQLAFLAGYEDTNIIKGETHGMAQMGGPVISTFACGDVVSPVLMPGTADVLIALEQSEILRPGFLDMLKPGGTILLATTRIIPPGLNGTDYPTAEQMQKVLPPYRIIRVDVLNQALELGDPTGRMANVVMLGLLSTLPPFDVFPVELWHEALRRSNPRCGVWSANYAAFNLGRKRLSRVG